MIHVTFHKDGKMDKFCSINTSSLNNPFCMKRHGCDGVCKSCYSILLLKMYKQAEKLFRGNGNIFMNREINTEEIPVINNLYCRLHSFGELFNELHYKNFVKIAKHNPNVQFALWTKRPELIENQEKPDNMIWIYSNSQLNFDVSLFGRFDRTFNVYTKPFIRGGIKRGKPTEINCQQKCITCLKCYRADGNNKIIREEKRK